MRGRRRFFLPLYAAYVALVLAAVLVTWYGMSIGEQESGRDPQRERMDVALDLLESWVVSQLLDNQDGHTSVPSQQGSQGLTVAIVRSDGSVLWGQVLGFEEPGVIRELPEFRQALSAHHHEGAAQRQQNGRVFRHRARAIYHEGHHIAWAWAASPLHGDKTSNSNGAYWFLLVVLAGASIGLLVLGYAFTKRVTHPVNEVTQAASAFAEGNYHYPLPAIHNDGIGELIGAFVHMRGRLISQLKTIDEDKRTLLTILSEMSEGLVAVDAEHRVLHINTAARQLLQVGDADVHGQFLWQRTRVPELMEAIDTCLSEQRDVGSAGCRRGM